MRPSARGLKVLTIAPHVFRRALFGYRRQDVDEAMAWRDSALAEETKRADEQMSRADLLTARINDEARRADAAVARATELELASLDLAGRVDALEQVADRLALRVVEKEQEISTLTARLEAALDELRDRVEAEVREEQASLSPGDVTPPPGGAEAEIAPADDAEADVFDGLVEVEIGPLSDFEQLVSFEDAAGAIGAAGDISVKRFTKGRATLELQLSEPVALLEELEDRAPFEFTVRDTRADRVVLDVDADAA